MKSTVQARLLPDAVQRSALPATLHLAGHAVGDHTTRATSPTGPSATTMGPDLAAGPATQPPGCGHHGQAGAGMLLVHQAYRFAPDPSPRQQRALASTTGGARFAYNWGLALVKERLDARAAGQDVEVPWTLPALRREWNQAKEQEALWWRENSKEAYSSGLDGLARGLRNWAGSRNGTRKGRREWPGDPKRAWRGHKTWRTLGGPW